MACGWALGLLVVVWCCSGHCLVSGIEGFLDEVSNLQCRSSDLRFSLPSIQTEFASVLTVLDNKGKFRDVHNDTTCGLWVAQNLDGSMTIGATYDGCYVRQELGDNVVTLIRERIKNGQVEHHKKDLKCPTLPALDAPSPSGCAAIQRTDRLLCANSSVPRNVCEQLDCCFSPGDLPQCYYGNKLTTRCTDGQILIALSKDLTAPSLILESAFVLGVDSSSCSQMTTSKSSAFLMFQFPLSCGKGGQLSGNSIVYENTVQAAMDVGTQQGSSVTRDSTMRLTVRCSFSQIGNVPLQVDVLKLPSPLPVSTIGLLEMRIAKDEVYTSYYMDNEYPVSKFLRDPVSLEVHILGRTDPNLILVLGNCWATPSSDPTQEVQWPILVNGCPFPGDNYNTRQLPVGSSSQAVPYPTHYQRFMVNTFTFVDHNNQHSIGGLVYFHCSAAVCVPSATESCQNSCGQRKEQATKENREEMTISGGPVNFIDPETPSHMMVDLYLSTQGDIWDYDLQNETSDTDFVGAEKEDTVDGDLIEMGKNIPKTVKGFDVDSRTVMWLRAAAVVFGVLALTTAMFGVWQHHRRQRPTMYSIKT